MTPSPLSPSRLAMVAVAGLSVCVGLSESQTPVCSSEQYSVAVAGGGAYCVECTSCGGGQKCIRQGAAAGCVDCPANTYNPDGDPVTGCLGAHRNNQRVSARRAGLADNDVPWLAAFPQIVQAASTPIPARLVRARTIGAGESVTGR
jgi:hypothetical protein